MKDKTLDALAWIMLFGIYMVAIGLMLLAVTE